MRPYLLEIKYEFLKLFRMPAYVIPTLTFPLLFYVFFGLIFGGTHMPGNVTMPAYLIGTYGAFAVIGASLFGFGVTVAVERGQGWIEVKRTTPMPRPAYFTSKMAMAMLFSAVDVLLLFALATTIGHVALPLATAAKLFGILVAGSMTFSALGVALGYFAGPNSAPAIVNLVYLPMSFLSGLWVPIFALPKVLREIAHFLPPYHFAQLALGVLGAGTGEPAATHVVAMVVATVLFLVVAAIGWRRDEGKLYG
ncbi:MAG TPA: ABC transporter permease [Thermoanaerobaculia bacterium]|nr:ABC transporter permease [Thermoanaerobaculia bacterium]